MYSNSNQLDDLALKIPTANSPLSSEVEKQGERRHRSTPPGRGEKGCYTIFLAREDLEPVTGFPHPTFSVLFQTDTQ